MFPSYAIFVGKLLIQMANGLFAVESRKTVPRVVVGILHPNESITRLIAGCVRFFTLIQCFERPA